jgi:cellulose synthase/poly-beta-1,6-N-acetylglucosamine synthase-like glycosyltransferase
MQTNSLQLIFWTSLALLFYTFLGYPLLMAALARLRPAQPQPKFPLERFPAATIVLAACNEQPRIAARIHNLLASDYPADKLNLIVVSDGSTDATVSEIEKLNSPRVRLIAEPQRRGKAHALNLALAAATSNIIIFTDVRQRFETETIARLAAHFADAKTGAVSGELMIESAASAVGGGVDFYWRLEKFLRHAESRWDSSIGCTGAVYAIRRELFAPLPADTILDDVVIPMRVAAKNFRVRFEPLARAYDPQTLEPHREQVRKRRTLAGNYQMLARQPAWLLPWRHRLWWQLISHKYLRLASPFLLAMMFAANAALARENLFRVLLLGQCAFYFLAAAGLVIRRTKIFSVPAGFVFLNWMSLAGLWHYLTHRRESAWELNGKNV